MLKLLITIAMLALSLLGNERVEVYATSIDTKDNILSAEGEVVVVYQDYYLSAKKALYDKNSGELELFENIHATQGENVRFLGEYAKLNIAQKERTFEPFYMLEQSADVWLSGTKGRSKESDIDVNSGMMSGCDPNNPLWKMEFTSSDYNTDSMWLNLYNARIYIYDIPVFYTPYFGYSLNTKRRTGILPPMMGLSNKEGFYYEQSLYIAEQNWWDLELKPQLRTNRGSGLYSTFRFVDSEISKGSLSSGFFREKEDYYLENSLRNQKHYGFNFLYENSDVIDQWFNTNFKGQSGLYMDIVNMNDVDYINLSANDTTKNSTATQLLSRINLFYNTDNNYFGTYFKHYKDLTLDSNEKTLQNLPSIHYHSYLDTLLNNHLLYSMDIKSNNYYRSVGKSATQTDLNIPLSLQTSLFDEHMNIAYKTNIYAQHTDFKGKEDSSNAAVFNDKYSSGLFARNYHALSLSSQLTRAYDEFTHVIDFGTQYQVAGMEFENGYYDEQKDYCSKGTNMFDPICEFYNIEDIKENLQIYFSHYLYDILGRQKLYHKLSLNTIYEERGGQENELENELDYQVFNNINYYNNMFYNYEEGGFSKNFNKISYTDDSFNIGLSHMYKNTFLQKSANFLPVTSYMTSSIGYKYDKYYSYVFKHNYDLERKDKKGFEVGFLYQKKCWDFGLTYLENNRPILSKGGLSDSIYDRYVYITIRLKPIMKSEGSLSGFVYRLPDKAEEKR